ncbi:MAG: FHA domain-containing protein [Anaerolineae bacterium]|nr:FHA domain-containing protein [Anaerolineae bacterium]
MGGGFCDKHGPYDPPHRTCPFCAREEAERRAYGPPDLSSPAATRPAGKPLPPPDPAQADVDQPDFVRQTVEHYPGDAAAGPGIEFDSEPDSAPDPAASDQAYDASPPTKDDITQVAPSHLLRENVFEEPSWIEGEPEPLGWMIVRWPADQRGQILPVRANQIIGRQGDVQWRDPRLSRQHARFTFEPADHDPDAGPVFHIWPFGPTNPVAVNGQPIRGATPVYENDEIQLGDTLFIFKTLLD